MLVNIKAGRDSVPVVLTVVTPGDVIVTIEDRKRGNYIQPRFSPGVELYAALVKYSDVLPWDVTDKMREEVVLALPLEIVQFLQFCLNAR